MERLPSGRTRPRMTERFPERSLAGHVAELVVEVEHLAGERVLPGDLRLEPESAEARRLEQAHFVLPSSESAPPRLEREEGPPPRTTLVLPLMPLPPEAGRQELVLPPLPIAIARASGEVFVLCSEPHRLLVEDPVANTPEAAPRDNPEPRRQREVWEAAKQAAFLGLGALVGGALLAWAFSWWRRRPKQAPPLPPPRLPWEVAEEELYDLERAGLIASQRFDEHFERVADVIRKYLGGRYGFDGLECTSRETLRVLRAIRPEVSYLPHIKSFLQQADLVKFARLTPSAAECTEFLERARLIVQRTLPVAPSAPSAPSAPAPNATATASALDGATPGSPAPEDPTQDDEEGRR